MTCPAKVIEIIPAHIHINMDESSRAGNSPTMTVGQPGVQGAAVAGIQGIGVRTPSAAAVAAATWGLAGDIHIPKVGIFSIGAKSMMVAAGMPDVVTVGADVAIKLAGATPIVHMSIAPVHTCDPIEIPSCVLVCHSLQQIGVRGIPKQQKSV